MIISVELTHLPSSEFSYLKIMKQRSISYVILFLVWARILLNMHPIMY